MGCINCPTCPYIRTSRLFKSYHQYWYYKWSPCNTWENHGYRWNRRVYTIDLFAKIGITNEFFRNLLVPEEFENADAQNAAYIFNVYRADGITKSKSTFSTIFKGQNTFVQVMFAGHSVSIHRKYSPCSAYSHSLSQPVFATKLIVTTSKK